MPQSHYKWYAPWLYVLLGSRTALQDASYLPRFGVSIRYDMHGHGVYLPNDSRMTVARDNIHFPLSTLLYYTET